MSRAMTAAELRLECLRLAVRSAEMRSETPGYGSVALTTDEILRRARAFAEFASMERAEAADA